MSGRRATNPSMLPVFSAGFAALDLAEQSGVWGLLSIANNEPLPTSVAGVLYRRTLFGPIFCRMHCRWVGFSNRLCRWRNAFQRHQARRRSLSAIGYCLVIGDRCFRRLPDGSLQHVTRTVARTLDTQKLLAIYPWADILELHIFLMGFDAGERWVLGNENIEPNRGTGS